MTPVNVPVPRQIVLNHFGDGAVMTITVRISRQFHLRLWAAKQLMRLASHALHCELEWIEHDTEYRERNE